MAKKGFNFSIYLVGMAVTLIGFCLPMFEGVFGKSGNGFKFINFDNSSFVTIGALLIIAGAIAGVVFALLGMGDQLEWLALGLSIAGAAACVEPLLVGRAVRKQKLRGERGPRVLRL